MAIMQLLIASGADTHRAHTHNRLLRQSNYKKPGASATDQHIHVAS